MTWSDWYHLTTNMKFLILAALVACASARPDVSHLEAGAQVLRSDSDVGPDSFQYAYETSNGIQAQAQGAVANPNSEYPSLSVKGSYGYKSPEGEQVEISYLADENGYQPTGSLLPTPPPVPEQIAKALAYIAAHPPQADTVVIGKRNF